MPDPTLTVSPSCRSGDCGACPVCGCGHHRCDSFAVLSDDTVVATYYSVDELGAIVADNDGHPVIGEVSVPLSVPVPDEVRAAIQPPAVCPTCGAVRKER